MILKEFIERFVEKNTLIRLQYKIKGGHEEVENGLKMEWELVNSHFSNRNVIGVTDIYIHKGPHLEAVNISIERE